MGCQNCVYIHFIYIQSIQNYYVTLEFCYMAHLGYLTVTGHLRIIGFFIS
jgi:hypothetical protein